MRFLAATTALLTIVGAASAQTLPCGPAGTGGTRGTMIDLRNDGTEPLRIDSLDFFYWSGTSAPASMAIELIAYTVAGGWQPNAGQVGNWTVVAQETILLTGATGSVEHIDLTGPTINPGETYGFAFITTLPAISQGTKALTAQVDAVGPYSNGELTAIPGAIVNNVQLEPNSFGIGTRMYSGSINYTVLDSCYADCDGSGGLDFFDFLCFQNEFTSATKYADCDASGALDFFDFLCFQNEFNAGCP